MSDSTCHDDPMAAERIRLHYAGDTFTLAEAQDPADVARRIRDSVQIGGGWVDVTTEHGRVSILASVGVPMWFDSNE